MRQVAMRKLALLFGMLLTGSASGENAAGSATQQCQAHCEAAEGDCSLAVHKAKTQCARDAATGGVDPITMRRDNGTYFCGYFNGDHCGYSSDRARCAERYRQRYGLCLDAYTQNTTQRYFECSDSERNALALCRDELADCRASCPQ